MLVTGLVWHRGGTRRRWRLLVGPVQLHDAATHAHCNWSVHALGDAGEIAAIEQLLDQVRLSHPIVTAG